MTQLFDIPDIRHAYRTGDGPTDTAAQIKALILDAQSKKAGKILVSQAWMDTAKRLLAELEGRMIAHFKVRFEVDPQIIEMNKYRVE